jgi:hypothetical protein
MSETARDLVLRVGGAALDVVEGLDPWVENEHELAALLLEHGWSAPGLQSVQPILDAWPDAAERGALRTALDGLRLAGEPDLSTIAPVAQAVAGMFDDMRAPTPPSGSLSAPFDKPRFWETFPLELAAELLSGYLELHQPPVFALLVLAGLIGEVDRPAEPSVGRLASRGDEIDWSLLGTLLSNPRQMAADAYGWGGDLDWPKLFRAASRAGRALGAQVQTAPAPTDLVALYYDANNPAVGSVVALETFLLRAQDPSVGHVELSLLAVPIPDRGTPAGNPRGLWLGLRTVGALGATVPLTTAATLSLRGGAQGGLPPGLEIVPDGPGLSHPQPPSSIDVGVGIQVVPPAPWRPLGAAEGTRIELAGAGVAVGLKGPRLDPELSLQLSTSGLTIVVDASAGDSFLQSILPAAPQTLELAGSLVWSSKTGLSFEGQAALQLVIPINRAIGPVELIELVIGLRAGTATHLTLEAGATAQAKLGPLALAVRNMGLRATLVEATDPVAAITFDQLGIAFGFKPPDGAGVSLGAGPVKGGGYLEFNEAEAQYAGIVHVEFKVFSLTAIGLLTTRLPDGGEGFSLLVIITADFPPIQLGWGFTLNGVGGLVGVNRSVVVPVLQEGLKQGSLGSVMFPEDPVDNAPKIIRDISGAFPATRDQFVVGPMVAIGWGPQPVIRAELGLILELPHPLRLLLLGKLMAGLPTIELAVAVIRIDVLGVLDFDKGTLDIRAALVDSHIATFPLTGQFALLASWRERVSLLMSAGGWNPRFLAPPGFPELDRLALTIFTGENPRLRLEGYFALTTASLQAGAHIDAHVHRDVPVVGRLAADGHLGFDVLVRLDPFEVVADFSGYVRISRNDEEVLVASVELHLTGPNPWHAWGVARFKFLGDREIPLDISVGEAAPPAPLPPVDPTDKLVTALGQDGSWSAELAAGDQTGVAVRDIEPNAGPVLHPMGRLRVQQRVLPLELELRRFGSSPVPVPRRYRIALAWFGSTAVTRTPTTDQFAPGQFLELMDDEKLTRPSFETFEAGVTLTSGAALAATTVVTADMEYATFVVDRIDPAPPPPAITAVDPAMLLALARSGPAARGPCQATAAERFGTDGLGIAVEDPRYAVSGADALQRVGPAPAATAPAGYSAAAQSAPTGTQVVPEHELVVA